MYFHLFLLTEFYFTILDIILPRIVESMPVFIIMFVCIKGGWLVEIQGNLFLMNFELLTFPCREMIKLSIHMTCFQNESISIQKTHLSFGACIVCIDIAKLQMRFLHYAFFSYKSGFGTIFLAIFWQN